MDEFMRGGAKREYLQDLREGDAAQADNDPGPDPVEFLHQVRLAFCQLVRPGLVAGRCASAHRGQKNIAQDKAVIPPKRVGPIGESCTKKGGVQEASACIASELPAGAVRAMRTRRKADHQHTCVGIAESRHGLPPVVPVAKGLPFAQGNLLPPRHQAGTFPTAYDLPVEGLEIHRAILL